MSDSESSSDFAPDEVTISSKLISWNGKKVLVFPEDRQIRIETGKSKNKVLNFDDKFAKDGIRLKNRILFIDNKAFNLSDY